MEKLHRERHTGQGLYQASPSPTAQMSLPTVPASSLPHLH